MKTRLYITSVAVVLSTAAAFAQTSYDVARYGYGELNGTARYVGMGGAMSALGADLSTMGTNPAGTAFFRSSWVAGSLGFNNTANTATFKDTRLSEGRTRLSFDQIGFVVANHVGNRAPLRFWNFGINYAKVRNLDGILRTGGFTDGLSQTMQMANMMNLAGDAYGIHSKSMMDYVYDDAGIYTDSKYYYPYLGIMGTRFDLVHGNGLKGNVSEAEFIDNYLKDRGLNLKDLNMDQLTDEQYNALAEARHAFSDQSYKNLTPESPVVAVGRASTDNGYRRIETGGVHRFDLNTSFNFYDRLYGGITLGLYDIDVDRHTMYTESLLGDFPYNDLARNDESYYTLNTNYSTKGSGIDLKLGLIWRPIESSPFRVGLAIHTPTWFNVTERYDSDINVRLAYWDETNQGGESTSQAIGTVTENNYILSTPWKFNLSAGTVFGRNLALGAEYEYADYRHARLRYNDATPNTIQNTYIGEDMRGVHTLRVGTEYRITPAVSLRAGYNYTTALYNTSAFKYLGYDDSHTDSDYENLYGRHTLTLGLGYSGKSFFADIAYKLDKQTSDFYAFDHVDLPTTKVNYTRNQVLCTLGFRF